jgi:hypothetical protein
MTGHKGANDRKKAGMTGHMGLNDRKMSRHDKTYGLKWQENRPGNMRNRPSHIK